MFGNENADPEVDNFVEDESDNEDSDRDIADPGDVEIPADFVPGNDDEVEGVRAKMTTLETPVSTMKVSTMKMSHPLKLMAPMILFDKVNG
jgi:hypothetical protein